MGQKIEQVDRWIVGFIKLLSHQRKKEVQVILKFCIEVLTSPQEDTDLSFFNYLFLYPSDNNLSYLSVTAGNLLSSEGKYIWPDVCPCICVCVCVNSEENHICSITCLSLKYFKWGLAIYLLIIEYLP